ncbi:unnamed protein product [Paramecium sonneborni]|uniref:Coproporphyrinogen oxidase n=1 Tax=Paramecium sonneborni TaxID=65129 RepID=A0A8S1LNZ6_9CILI|nr:unnamed protein product [Paramecium sonneborni]
MDPKQSEDVFSAFVDEYQKNFFEMLFRFESKAEPIKEAWTREDGRGHGLTCVIQDGNFFEKAGVNVSRITIPLSQGIFQQMKGRRVPGSNLDQIDMNNLGQYDTYANGVSLVIHPINPFCPTVHANFRTIRIKERETGKVIDSWFGGGSDLTPIYLFDEDAKFYHQNIRDAIVEVTGDDKLYRQFKKECDEYFVNHHRKEARGIGGVFYDDFNLESFEKGLEFQKAVAYANLKSYEAIINKRKDTPYNDENVRWRTFRRGRYAEFNLIHDRGTKFGLMTPDARIESILMSLPLTARWEYNYHPKEGTEEARIVGVLLKPVDWV